MYGFTYFLLAATILIVRTHAVADCSTHEFNLTGAANNFDVNGQYIINIYEDDVICENTGNRYVWKRVFPATPVRYIYFDAISNRWAVSDQVCHNTASIQWLRTYNNRGAPKLENAYYWTQKTNAGGYSLNRAIRLVCITPECKEWSALTPLTPGVCVRQNCMKKPRATEALCHAPCGGCGKASSTRTCLAGLRQPGGIYGTVQTITSRCNVVPCDGRVFSQKYEFIKHKFTAYRRWAKAYMLRKCCVNFNANKAELAKRRYCTRVGGLV